MKRELKGIRIGHKVDAAPEVTQHVPMKRELKVPWASLPWSSYSVTQHVPMKRELKALHLGSCRPVVWGYTACPNEEGTERRLVQQERKNRLSYTACPNEEGTERKVFTYSARYPMTLHSMSQWRGNWKDRWNTPQNLNLRLHSMSQWRGNWKFCNPGITFKEVSVTQHVPMKRELKD